MTRRHLLALWVAAWLVITGCVLPSLPISTMTSDPNATEASSSNSDRTASYSPSSTFDTAPPVSSPSPVATNKPAYLANPTDTAKPMTTGTRLVPSSQVTAGLPIFGIETNPISSSGGMDQILQTGTRWVRRNGIVWSDIEPTQGARAWNAVASLEQELRYASSRGVQVILIVRGAPTWARKISSSGCGPIRQDKFAAFGSFMRDLVARYSVAPYNIKYWELGNEPDVDPSLVSSDSPFGCWGDQNDPYYGGGYYADMLKVVYPQIKAIDGQAQVAVGGLLLDCDPRSICTAINHDAKPSKFLEGILKTGGGAYFDGIGFHAYDVYSHELGKYGNPNWKTAWNTTGPTLVGKSEFVKSLLSSYGVSGKFLMNTETAVRCGSCDNDATFENTKAFYLVQAFTTAIAHGLRANIWYSVLGWQNSGLLDGKMNALPAFGAFKFASTELRSVQPLREITVYPGVRGYEFNRGDRLIWVLWSLDGTAHRISLAGVPLAVYHADGTPVPPSSSLNVTLEPGYLELNP